jgi:GTPase SAR1 family protein
VRGYVEGRFDDKCLSTIGVKISRKVLERDEYSHNLLIWDLAGGEDFGEISQRYLLGALGALIVCDLTRVDTLPVMGEYAMQMRAMDDSVGIV